MKILCVGGGKTCQLLRRALHRLPTECYASLRRFFPYGAGSYISSHVDSMTITVKDKTELVVPPSVRRRAGIKAGDRLEFKVSGGVIAIVPKLPAADDEYTPAQRRAINARLARADEDIKQGRVYGPFDNAEDMAASIESNIKKLRAAKRKPKRAR